MLIHIVVSGQVYLVDNAYQDEPSDTSYPLYTIDNQQVGSLEAKVLQQIATPVPSCTAQTYATKIQSSIAQAVATIDVRPVLRLLVNNATFIHAYIAPVLKEDIINREGGQYFAYQKDASGNLVLFGGNTAKELYMCIDANIPACKNMTMLTLQSPGFFEALDALKAMYVACDVCAVGVDISHAQNLHIPSPGEEQDETPPHCAICIAQGLDGRHGWNNDATVYESGFTTDSLYKRTGADQC